MQLSAFDAVNDGFIVDFNGEKLNPFDYRGKASVDLGIKEILLKDSEESNFIECREKYIIRPQETVCVISRERVVVPENHVAYVFLKNRLSQMGLFSFNTGIIDPGFDGPVSTVMTNLSRESIELSNNQDNHLFFRVVFHKMTNSGELTNSEKRKYSYRKYKEYRISDLKKFPYHFLDPSKIKAEVDKSLTDKAGFISNRKFAIISFIFAAFLTILPIVVSVAIQVTNDKFQVNKDEINKIKTEIENLKNKK
ncbi:dCTP deaminase domain-containing protein [Lacimicrobium alkaliphilum]|uniref:Uncharacterized protein n=1 Tax=Lacimicrobium alkaliphilum TaxID=1526571 RepID=A0A0U2JI92_9ALTE|nr:hypothetical protein [Lacimicrobium alkaliphilum]ALS97174.1 hypothetical protein AT746_02015 [Lacimicrobium alkaliphilum]